MPDRAWFYAEGWRWIGSLFTSATDRLERTSAAAPLEPREYRAIERYVDELRTRVHIHF